MDKICQLTFLIKTNPNFVPRTGSVFKMAVGRRWTNPHLAAMVSNLNYHNKFGDFSCLFLSYRAYPDCAKNYGKVVSNNARKMFKMKKCCQNLKNNCAQILTGCLLLYPSINMSHLESAVISNQTVHAAIRELPQNFFCDCGINSSIWKLKEITSLKGQSWSKFLIKIPQVAIKLPCTVPIRTHPRRPSGW